MLHHHDEVLGRLDTNHVIRRHAVPKEDGVDQPGHLRCRLRHLLHVETVFLAHRLIVCGELFDVIANPGSDGVWVLYLCSTTVSRRRASAKNSVLWQPVMRGHLLHFREEAQPEFMRLAKHVDEKNHSTRSRRLSTREECRHARRTHVHPPHRLALHIVFGCQEGLDELFDARGERCIGWRCDSWRGRSDGLRRRARRVHTPKNTICRMARVMGARHDQAAAFQRSPSTLSALEWLRRSGDAYARAMGLRRHS